MTDQLDNSTSEAIPLDPSRLLGYWLLPEDRLTPGGEGQKAIHLKMGGKGGGTKFFGGNAGIRRRVT